MTMQKAAPEFPEQVKADLGAVCDCDVIHGILPAIG